MIEANEITETMLHYLLSLIFFLFLLLLRNSKFLVQYSLFSFGLPVVLRIEPGGDRFPFSFSDSLIISVRKTHDYQSR